MVSILVAGIGAAITELSQLIAALTRKNTIESEITDKQRQIDDLNTQLELLGEVKSQLQRCAEEASEMFGRLGSFSSIWDMAARDADLVSKSDLDKVHTDKIVQTRIELIQASYFVLADALGEYATKWTGYYGGRNLRPL
ncbi:hypothetical protein PAXRUDRAFT_455937 [Paxillus rubicundulus Ve08.2h10]|uniref:Uncharacterized protein n=1 Tax=Paxillus rubicundulus Ve08.2h10 TaxID=930991 RepID=A0A0D0DEL9_9AGAM|nr:hypothetical protein PAXRUDRAFT_455937 [Paxillus rubicundulus Ve08.2h10]